MNKRILPLFLWLAFIWNGFAQNELSYNQPESIVFDAANDQYIISNNGGSGHLLFIANDERTGTPTEFTAIVNAPAGLLIIDDIVYVGDEASIKGFRLSNADLTFNLPIPEESSLINDLVTDGQGTIYATGTGSQMIYKVDIKGEEYEPFATVTGGPPNGLFYDAPNNRLIVVFLAANSPIEAVSLTDGSVSTIATTSFLFLDGITQDLAGHFYISSFVDGNVYKYTSDFSGEPEIFSLNHAGPADLYFNKTTNTLAIPNFSGNTIDFIDFEVTKVNSLTHSSKLTLQLLPNPAINSVQLNYHLAKSGDVTIQLFDSVGRLIQINNIFHQRQGEQTYWLNWHDKDLSNGLYLLKVSSGEQEAIHKLIINN